MGWGNRKKILGLERNLTPLIASVTIVLSMLKFIGGLERFFRNSLKISNIGDTTLAKGTTKLTSLTMLAY